MRSKLQAANNGALARILGIGVIVGSVGSLLFANLAALEPRFEANRFIQENVSIAFLISAGLLASALVHMQQYTYWPLWGKTKRSQADERQITVRQRVFERSYRSIIFIGIFSLWFTNTDDHRARLALGWVLGILFLTLPSMYAAWQKDS